MSKVRVRLMVGPAALVAIAASAPVAAAPAGSHGDRCAEGHGPAMLVRVSGFRARTGTVRVQSYGGDPAHWFDKGSYLDRVEVPVPARGDLDVCMPVPQPGTYAISVRHDANGSGNADRADGGGMSGNPHLSLFDVMLKRRPDPDQVAVPVTRGVRTVPVTLNYLSGGSFRPVGGAD